MVRRQQAPRLAHQQPGGFGRLPPWRRYLEEIHLMNDHLRLGAGTDLMPAGSRADLQPLTTALAASDGRQDWQASRRVTWRPNINAGAPPDLRVRDLSVAACSEKFGKGPSRKGWPPVDFRMRLFFYRTASRYVVRLVRNVGFGGVAPMFPDTSLMRASVT